VVLAADGQAPGALWLLVALMAATSFALWFIFAARCRPALKIGLLLLLGYAIQIGLAWTEGRGLDGIRDRIVHTGHAEFAAVAVSRESALDVVKRYELLLAEGELGDFAHAKPPGQVLIYMATERVGSWIHGGGDLPARYRWLCTFAAVVWPFVSVLALLPIYWLMSLLGDRERGLLACALYLLIPSVELITLHTDQVVFPALLMLVLVSAVVAFRRGSPWLGLVTGALCYLAVFCSFVLAWSAVLVVLLGLGIAWNPKAREMEWRGPVRAVIGMAAGFVVLAVGFRLAFAYDIGLRYHSAMAYHLAWKGWEPGLPSTLTFAATNLVEFAVWLGVPVTSLALWSMVRSARALPRDPSLLDWLAVAWGVTVLAVALTGHTKGEVARLWLFLVPVACILAADGLHRWFIHRRSAGLVWIAILQAGTLYVIKRFQDFW
jgi:hypothetical protein